MRTISLCLLLGASAVGLACSSESDSGADEANATRAADIFEGSSAVSLSLAAPLEKLFERRRSGQVDPVQLDDAGQGNGEAAYSEPGQLELSDGASRKKFDVRIYIRGESSQNDCPFPKLKIKFSNKDQLKGTAFKGHGTMRLNTHCGPGDASARSGMGRVLNGVGPVREELTYRLIRAANVPTYLTRVAQITYTDTDTATKTDSFGMLLESGDDAAQRFVKAGLIEAEGVYLDRGAYGMIAPENSAQIIVAEALAGNGDFQVDGTHNVDTFGVPNGQKFFKIPQDFDLGAIAVGDKNIYWRGDIPIANASQGLQTPGTVEHFLERKEAMAAALAQATKDAIAAKAIPSEDGVTTKDSGFAKAEERINALFALPEFAGH